LLANRITDVPGASAVFLAGFVAYSNAAKTDSLGVSDDLLTAHGAVSEEVVRAMALGAIERCGARYALATTGIAGPGGGSPDKPVGTVWLALAQRDGEVISWKQSLPLDRKGFKRAVTQAALDRLRRHLESAARR
jgi:nicotinamide-nucleotide amidase